MKFISKDSDALCRGYDKRSYYSDYLSKDTIRNKLGSIDCFVKMNSKEYMGGFTVFTRNFTTQSQVTAGLTYPRKR